MLILQQVCMVVTTAKADPITTRLLDYQSNQINYFIENNIISEIVFKNQIYV